MATINDPVLNKIVNEDIRPMAERARALFAQAQLMSAYSNDFLTQLNELQDDDIINDNRLNEGVSPLNVLQLKNCINLLTDLLLLVNRDTRLPSVLNACVRKSIRIE